MDLFHFLTLIGGLSLFLFGMSVMGQNIGTCVTALLSSVGTNKNARRAAMVHLSFNVIGTVFCLTVFCLAKALWQPVLLAQAASLSGIAVVHTVFNVLCNVC